MHIRFRRTFHVLPGVRLNVSKHGISTTVGARGMHLTFNRYGVRQSVGLPGTGLSENSYLVGGGRSGSSGLLGGLLGGGRSGGRSGGSESTSGRSESAEEEARRHVNSIHHGEGLGCALPGLGCLGLLLVIAVAAMFFGTTALHLHPIASIGHALAPIEHSIALWAKKMHL